MSILKLKRKNIIIISLIVLFLLIINPLLGFIGEKAAPKMLPDYIGRSISIENIDINLYTGTLLLEDFAIFEPDGKERFFTFNKFFINIQILKLFKKKIHIETIELVEPSISIKVENKKFNFDDIITHIASMKKPDAEPEKKDENESNIQLLIEKISIENTGFSFSDTDRGLNLAYNIDDFTISNLNMDEGISLFSNLFHSKNFEIDASLDSKGDDYLIGINIKKFNLKYLLPIVKHFLNSSEIKGNVNADLKIVASKSFKKISISGVTKLLNFIVLDSRSINIFSIDSIDVKLNKFDNISNRIDVESITIERPVLQFYETNEGNTIDLLKKPQAEKEEETTVSKEEKVEKSKESKSKLSLKSLKLKNGSITYQDYKLKGNPRVVVSRVNTDISNFSNFEDKKALIDFSSSIGTKGTIRSNGYAKIFGVKDANITTAVENIDLSKLRKILNSRSPVKIKQGEVNFDGKLKLKNREIDSENKLILHDIELLDNKKAVFGTKVPLSILLTILEDTKKNITLDIPVKGDLSKPSFKIGTVIAGVLKDLVLNIISSPLKILKALGGVKEDITFLEWGYFSAESDINLKKLNQLSGIVKNKENIKIAFNEKYKASALKNEIGLLLVENIYFDDMRKQKPEVKNKELDVMSIEFQDFVSSKTTETDGKKSLDEKIELIVGKEVIEKEVQNILKKKRDTIKAAFDEQKIDPSRFIVNENKVIDSDSENIIYEVSVGFLSGP